MTKLFISLIRKLEYDIRTLEYVQNRLFENWFPEQIANRETKEIYIIPSPSLIYTYIYKELSNKVIMKNLRRKENFKRPVE